MNGLKNDFGTVCSRFTRHKIARRPPKIKPSRRVQEPPKIVSGFGSRVLLKNENPRAEPLIDGRLMTIEVELETRNPRHETDQINGSMMTLMASWPLAASRKPRPVSAKGKRCVIIWATRTWRVRINSTDSRRS